MEKARLLTAILAIFCLLTVGCSDVGQEETEESTRRETVGFTIDENAEYEKLADQYGFDRTLSKYAFTEPDIAEFEDEFFAPDTVQFNYNKNYFFTEGDDGDVFAFDMIPKDENEEENGNYVNGILKYDKYGSVERICIDPYCTEESECHHMNLFALHWEYFEGSLYFLCNKWLDGEDIGTYILEYDIDEGVFHKVVDIPGARGMKFEIIDGYAYAWSLCTDKESKMYRYGESCVVVVDIDGNRACCYPLDVADVYGFINGYIAVRSDDSSSPSLVLIDPNTGAKTKVLTLDHYQCGIIGEWLVIKKGRELLLYEVESGASKTIDDDACTFYVNENAIWYDDSDRNLIKYDPFGKKRESVARKIRWYYASGDSCVYATSSDDPVELEYSEMMWVWDTAGENREYKDVLQSVHAVSDADIWFCKDGKVVRLYQTKSSEYLESLDSLSTFISDNCVFTRILIHDGTVRNYLEYKMYRLSIGGGASEVIDVVHGSSYESFTLTVGWHSVN